MDLASIILTVAGTFLIWRFGVPPTVGRDGRLRITEVYPGEPKDGEQLPQQRIGPQCPVRLYRWLSALGFLCLLVALGLQVLNLKTSA